MHMPQPVHNPTAVHVTRTHWTHATSSSLYSVSDNWPCAYGSKAFKNHMVFCMAHVGLQELDKSGLSRHCQHLKHPQRDTAWLLQAHCLHLALQA